MAAEPARPAWCRLMILAGAIPLALAGCGGSDAAPASPASAPSPSPAPTPAAGARAAADYIASRGAQYDAVLTLLIAHLERGYGQAWLAPMVTRAQARADAGYSEAAVLARLVTPAAAPKTEQLASLADTNAVLGEALYCDRLPLRPDFDATLGQYLKAGSYYLTHAAIAIAWATELGCITGARADDLTDRAVTGVQTIAADGPAVTDLRLEALALLTYFAPDAVEPRWIDQVVGAQRADGRFQPADGGEGDPQLVADHATSLGLWVLLAASQPDAAPFAWVAGGAPRA